MLGVEPRRYGDYVSKSYLIEKNEEAYSNVFTIHYPDEEEKLQDHLDKLHVMIV